MSQALKVDEFAYSKFQVHKIYKRNMSPYRSQFYSDIAVIYVPFKIFFISKLTPPWSNFCTYAIYCSTFLNKIQFKLPIASPVTAGTVSVLMVAKESKIYII